jgi:hypothetical protein
MKEARHSIRRSTRWSTRIRTRQKISKRIAIYVPSVIKVSHLDSLTMESKLIQVTSTTTKHSNKIFLSRLGGFFSHLSLGVEGWLSIGWVVSFDGFDCFLLHVVAGGKNKLGSTLLTLLLRPLKTNTQFGSGPGCTLLNPTQIVLNHFLTHH